MLFETPLQKIDTNLFMKREDKQIFKNIKSRAAYFMLLEAEKSGFLDPLSDNNPTIVEGSSGNTARSLAHFATSRGYKVQIIVSESIPEIKKRLIQEAGAELVFDAACIEKAEELGKQDGYINLNQYFNEANTRSHVLTTGPEILYQLREQTGNSVLDSRDVHIFATIGTGGTVKGLHECGYNVHAVEPQGSIFSLYADEETETVEPSYRPWGDGSPLWRGGIASRKLISSIASISQIGDDDVKIFLDAYPQLGPTSIRAAIAALKFRMWNEDKLAVSIAPDSRDNYDEESLK